jgi:Kef-type K+ transport system membrane component KefB
MLLFLVAAFLLGIWLLPRAAGWVGSRPLPISEALMSLVVLSILGFAWMSEVVGGVAAITGAFIAGVALSTSSWKEEIERGIHILAYALFVPVFLVSIGLAVDVRLLSAADFGLAAAVTVVAILSKLLGAGFGARLGGMAQREAVRVGVGMISRGEVGLIVATVGLNAGIIDADGFTIIMLMVLVTTLVTPPLLRVVFREEERDARTDRLGTG